MLPPLVIFKGTYHQWGRYDNSVPQDWVIGISPKGWTDETLSLEWLQRIFDIRTKPTKEDQYRLLLVDGHHSSHISWEYIEHCLDNKIIALCLSPHSTHWLQPLDVVGVFSPLQHYYCSEVVRNGLVSNTKPLFITLYSKARTQAFQSRTITSAFAKTGMIPFNPSRVIEQLPNYTRPTLSEPEPPIEQPLLRPKTPENTTDIKAHLSAIFFGLQDLPIISTPTRSRILSVG